MEIQKLAQALDLFYSLSSKLNKFAGPKWVANEKIWDRAEKAVSKKKYKGDSYYKVVTDVYFKMGGKKKKPKKKD